jgi:arginine:ornithine antiporter/lysine permease
MAIWTGIVGTLYSAWLLYAAGLEFVLMSTIVYAAGLPVYWYAQRERAVDKPGFTRIEVAAAGALTVAATIAVILFTKGIVSIG